MTPTPTPPHPRDTGFTLLELVLAMLLLTMIVGMVFGTARTSLQLGVSVVETQNEAMLQQAFFDLLAGRFSSMPGNARLDLTSEDSGTHHLSELTLQNVPMSFTWGGQDRIAKAVQLATVKRRSNYLDIVLRYYEEEIIEDPESTMGSNVVAPEPFAEIVLLEDIRFFEWRALDGRSMEWYYDWDLPGRLPLQVELVLAFGATGPEMRHVFWIPPRQNPTVVNRQMMQEAQQNNPGQPGDGGSPGRGGGPGRGGSPPTIEIPGIVQPNE
jgi:type II secretory pathway pseudopilin PulG